MQLLGLSIEHLILIGVILIILIIIPVIFVYKYAKNKGRLEELEKKIKKEN